MILAIVYRMVGFFARKNAAQIGRLKRLPTHAPVILMKNKLDISHLIDSRSRRYFGDPEIEISEAAIDPDNWVKVAFDKDLADRTAKRVRDHLESQMLDLMGGNTVAANSKQQEPLTAEVLVKLAAEWPEPPRNEVLIVDGLWPNGIMSVNCEEWTFLLIGSTFWPKLKQQFEQRYPVPTSTMLHQQNMHFGGIPARYISAREAGQLIAMATHKRMVSTDADQAAEWAQRMVDEILDNTPPKGNGDA